MIFQGNAKHGKSAGHAAPFPLTMMRLPGKIQNLHIGIPRRGNRMSFPKLKLRQKEWTLPDTASPARNFAEKTLAFRSGAK
jgi:hypothetical protein